MQAFPLQMMFPCYTCLMHVYKPNERERSLLPWRCHWFTPYLDLNPLFIMLDLQNQSLLIHFHCIHHTSPSSARQTFSGKQFIISPYCISWTITCILLEVRNNCISLVAWLKCPEAINHSIWLTHGKKKCNLKWRLHLKVGKILKCFWKKSHLLTKAAFI